VLNQNALIEYPYRYGVHEFQGTHAFTKEVKVSTTVTRTIEVNASTSRSGSVPFA
jgi:hypothetical protein